MWFEKMLLYIIKKLPIKNVKIKIAIANFTISIIGFLIEFLILLTIAIKTKNLLNFWIFIILFCGIRNSNGEHYNKWILCMSSTTIVFISFLAIIKFFEFNFIGSFIVSASIAFLFRKD